ncbi:type IX secretion system membrane protein PorP/SprF [Hymenobacter sp. J193]|uniref:PorP/SprF family type IX secretion system membrane protein n=1 Tax=Hymenobacter sp. J193 TaxID=2898429 RepID=UPI0021513865|nr:type IX secretion system membrane protein PorP/SprF [Hymenobacter sp. J193]MCR5887813.1 type IX secretion system membrane protein PorP/SprF [Hymenobacter sp. J193]
MRVPVLIGTLACLATGSALAQQQPQFTHYGFNGIYLNPAYAGVKGYGEITTIGRYQYLGYQATLPEDAGGSPQTYLLSASVPVKFLHGGLGAVLYRDRIAETKITTANVSYAYHITIGEGKLGIGVQGIYTHLGKGTYRPAEEGDPAVPNESADRKFDLGTGVWYESEKLYAGLSVNNLLRSKYQFQNVDGNTASSVTGENHAYLTLGYNIEATPSVVVTPSALVKMVLPGKVGDGGKFSQKSTSFELGGRATLDDKYWAGLGYRFQESFQGMLGASFTKDNALRVGYAFDFIAFNQEARAFSSHEIMLSYRLPRPVSISRPAIRTPRYSF